MYSFESVARDLIESVSPTNTVQSATFFTLPLHSHILSPLCHEPDGPPRIILISIQLWWRF